MHGRRLLPGSTGPAHAAVNLAGRDARGRRLLVDRGSRRHTECRLDNTSSRTNKNICIIKDLGK